MLLTLIAATVLLPQSATTANGIALNDPLTGEENGMILQRTDRLDPPKLSPKKFDGKPWEFDWVTTGYGKPPGAEAMEARFRVFSQERKPLAYDDRALEVATMQVRMWQLLNRKYKIDHPFLARELRMIDTYLCWGGVAGGEQMTTQDVEAGQVRKASTIYIYDIASFKDPVEMAREVAHEYGHAVLPAVGGFKQPEDWANGYLGEKLFLRWLRDVYSSGEIEQHAVMGATYQGLDAWVKKNVDPLIRAGATKGPSVRAGVMSDYLGLALYADQILPQEIAAKALKMANSAPEYAADLVDAVSGVSYTVRVGPLGGKAIWLPTGKGKVQGAKVLSQKNGWTKVQVGSQAIVVLAG